MEISTLSTLSVLGRQHIYRTVAANLAFKCEFFDATAAYAIHDRHSPISTPGKISVRGRQAGLNALSRPLLLNDVRLLSVAAQQVGTGSWMVLQAQELLRCVRLSSQS